MADVNTKELELQILKMKVDKLMRHVNEISERAKRSEITASELLEELKIDRKEMIDCVTLQLGLEVIGPVAALKTVEIISHVDTLIFQLKMLTALGL